MPRTIATFRASLVAMILFFLLIGSALPAAGQVQARESDVVRLIGQAEEYIKKGDHKLAIGCYLEASALSQSRMNLSQSYFGLAKCYFALRDTTNATKYIRKVLEVDPNKEISELFYPTPFVRLFNQIRAEAGAKPAPPVEQVTPPQPVPAKTEPEKVIPATKLKTESKTQTQAQTKEAEKVAVKPAPKPSVPVVVEDVLPAADRGGHWEVSGHYSKWSVNFIKSFFEDTLKEELAEEIQNQIVKASGKIQAGLVKQSFRQDLSFDSDGSNFGFEIRYFSRGRAGTFSLGLALEKTDLAFMLGGPVTQEFSNGATATVEATTKLVTSPFSTHVNFRWEVGADAILTPYFTLGFGFAPLNGTLTYDYTGTFRKDVFVETISDAQEKTLDELSKDIDFRFPDVLVIFQLSFGLKAQLYRGLYLLGEAGLWDGIILRGGLAVRF